jgi:C-terminal processing protease CtpA/Prc
MMIRICTVILTLLFCGACTSKSVTESSGLNGIWESVGSGWILEIKDSTAYQFYDVTSISCLARRQGSFKELENNLSLKNDTLSLLKGVITYDFVKRNETPQICQDTTINTRYKDPLYNFEVFAETIKEHYAFFERNNIQWEALYKKQKSKLSQTTSEKELYAILDETLELIKDNHAYLEATDEVQEIIASTSVSEEVSTTESLPEYGDIQVSTMVANHHLKEDLTRNYNLKSPLIQWGKLTDNIGYVQIKTMWLFADLKLEQNRIDTLGFVDAYVEAFYKLYEGSYIDKEGRAVADIMDMVMNDLSAMEAIVLDVRFNGGGQDAVSFEILSRFITNETLRVATQKLRFGNQHTPLLPLFIKGKDKGFDKSVYVLTSQQTGSAAEVFAIATMAMNNVKRIGASTSGAMSTALEKTLPNGWSFSISNEVYMDNLGNNYENIGILVDYELEYPKDRQTFFRSVVNDLENDLQEILDAIDVMKG